jgi:hypothetical protein
MHFSSVVALASLASIVSSHGLITSPYPRAVGAASLANCGTGVTQQIKADNTSHVEGLPEAAAVDKNYKAALCNLWLCKGLQLADNTANVQTYTPGQVVPITVSLRIKHAGTANVSVVDTKTNKIIGAPLLYWDKYADEKLPALPANNTKFSVTIPTSLGSQCAAAGACVSSSSPFRRFIWDVWNVWNVWNV